MEYYINKTNVEFNDVEDIEQLTVFIKMREILEYYGAEAIEIIKLKGSSLKIENLNK